jgi:hypothetical protein
MKRLNIAERLASGFGALVPMGAALLVVALLVQIGGQAEPLWLAGLVVVATGLVGLMLVLATSLLEQAVTGRGKP